MAMRPATLHQIRTMREQSGVLQILAPIDDRDPNWLALRLALWPDISKAEQLLGMRDALARDDYVRLATSNEGVAVGLVEASKRREFPGRAKNGPIVFFEGLYVSRKHPSALIATRRLVQGVTSWAATTGCNEVAFDSRFVYVAAQTLLGASRFQQTQQAIYFRKAAP